MMATARKRKRGAFKGRTQVAFGLMLFIAVCVLVVWRRSVGVSTAKELRDLSRERASLQSQIITLRSELGNASKRSSITAAAEKRLGLHIPTEWQTRSIADSVALPDSSDSR